jgi:hypothetical protein
MRATDPIITIIGNAFEFFLTFTMVWTVLFFLALPIGMGKEEKMGKSADVKRKALYSALVSASVSAIIFYFMNNQ